MNTKPNKDLRLVHHIVVGVDKTVTAFDNLDQAYDAIKCGITRHAGGVVAFITDGTWAKESELGLYDGAIEEDIALNFIATLTYEEEGSGAWEAIKSLIADIVREFDLGCHHIHTAMWIAQAKHFHVMEVEANNDNCGASDNCGVA